MPGPMWVTSDLAIDIPEPLLGHHTGEARATGEEEERTTPKGRNALAEETDTATRRVVGRTAKKRKSSHEYYDCFWITGLNGPMVRPLGKAEIRPFAFLFMVWYQYHPIPTETIQ